MDANQLKGFLGIREWLYHEFFDYYAQDKHLFYFRVDQATYDIEWIRQDRKYCKDWRSYRLDVDYDYNPELLGFEMFADLYARD